MITPCNDVITSFSAILIRIRKHSGKPTVRLMLVETAKTRAVYERFGTWGQCERWLASFMSSSVAKNKLVGVQKHLGRKNLAIIVSVMVSRCQLECLGFPRADCC
jgi:hypothetical protein